MIIKFNFLLWSFTFELTGIFHLPKKSHDGLGGFILYNIALADDSRHVPGAKFSLRKVPLQHFGAPNGSSTLQGIKIHHPL